VRALYLETSAVLRWLLGEPRGARAASLIEEADEPICSVLTILESKRALIRAERDRIALRGEVAELRALLGRVSRRWTLMEISPEIRQRAAGPFPVEPVRTLDALHLATILEFARVHPDLSVLTVDRRIVSNLKPLGLHAAIEE
jgi:predicted nucleic acid-binding protein